MAINSAGFSADSIEDNPSFILDMVLVRPEENVNLATPVQPGQIVGFYNSQLGYVELFVGNPSGNRWIGVS